MDGPAIRALTAEDRPHWRALWGGYLDFYGQVLPEAVTQETFARLLDPGEPMFALIAEQQGAPVGFVHCVRHRATWSIADHCYLEDLFVAAGARGAGLGRMLIEAVYVRADAMGCARVHWLTQATNTPARALYDKIAQRSGFIQYRRA